MSEKQQCNRPLVFSVFIVVLSLGVSAADSDSSISKASGLVRKLYDSSVQRAGGDEPATIIENPNRIKRAPEYGELKQVLRNDWPRVINNIDVVAPSDLSKTIVLVAAQSLPPDDYLQFLDGVVGLAESSRINKRLLRWALFPSDKNVRGVLEYNYDSPVAKSILRRGAKIYAEDADMVRYFNAALKGDVKKNEETYLADNPEEPAPAQKSGVNTKGVPSLRMNPTREENGSRRHSADSLTGIEETAGSGVVWVALISCGVIGLIIVALYKWRKPGDRHRQE